MHVRQSVALRMLRESDREKQRTSPIWNRLKILDLFMKTWVLKKREERRLEAAQMKFLRHLHGITKLDKEKNQCFKEKTGAQNIVKEIKQYQKKWLQHVQRMDINT